MTRRALALAFLCSTAFNCAAPAYADTTRDRMPQIYTMTPMGVNIQSGTFVHSETDFTIGSLSFVRAWRSVPSVGTPFSPIYDHHSFGGWNHNYGFAARWHPTINDGVEIYADGKVYQFRWTSVNSTWTPWNLEQHNNNAFGTQLTGSVDSNLVFRNRNGDIYTFNANNQATSVVYIDGTRLDLSYDASRRLRTVLSNRGDAIVLDYGANGMLAAACGFNRALIHVPASPNCTEQSGMPKPHVRTSYGYAANPSGQAYSLTSVTGADNQVTTMTYDTYFRPNLTCIKPPGFAVCPVTNEYGPNAQNPNHLGDQVRRQVTANNEIWSYTYENMDQYADWPPIEFGEIRATSGEMTDPLGRTTRAEYENGFLKRLRAPEGLTQYSWGMLNPTHLTSPGGNVEILGYTLNNDLASRTRRAVPGSGEADLVSTLTYPSTCDATNYRLCNKPVQTVPERTNPSDLTRATDYTYDVAHGGVLTATRPAVMVRQANGVRVSVRPQTRYTYQQISAGLLNSSGTGYTAASAVWVLTQESECRTTSSCAGTADEVRTIYEYGPSGTANALRLRGRTVTDNATSVRTCFTYDTVGNRISETGPGAQLASCPAQ